MRIVRGFNDAREALSRRSSVRLSGDEREQVVREVINDVARRGDAALLEYTERFDGVSPAAWEVSQEQIQPAYRKVNKNLVEALNFAAARIRTFHEKQRESIRDGVVNNTGWLFRPLERVGVYAPGGTAPLPSSLLMTAIPARVAGVKEVILATPPGPGGVAPPVILVAADIAGVDRIFNIGGAQAIAALAFGTESVPGVDKICGAGNIYVTLAKKLVFGIVGIDGLYGPSEVLIIADETADAADCAADILAQAEHDVLSSAILITTSSQLAGAVEQEVARQIKALSRRSVAAESLEANGLLAVVDSLDEALYLANRYAPEHLLLMVAQAQSYIDRFTNAGCIVTGGRATVPLGDYVAGPSHVLPTEGTARFSSPLNVIDFLKITNVITVNEPDLAELGPNTSTLARAEGMNAHEKAVKQRMKKGRA